MEIKTKLGRGIASFLSIPQRNYARSGQIKTFIKVLGHDGTLVESFSEAPFRSKIISRIVNKAHRRSVRLPPWSSVAAVPLANGTAAEWEFATLTLGPICLFAPTSWPATRIAQDSARMHPR